MDYEGVVRAVQFRGGRTIAPISLFFTHTDTLLVAPGRHKFTR